MQAWGFANILFEPGEEFWQLVGQNAIWHIHDYSAQNIANGEDLHLCTIFAVHDVCQLVMQSNSSKGSRHKLS